MIKKNTETQIEFEIYSPGEKAAGLRPFQDTITVNVKHGFTDVSSGEDSEISMFISIITEGLKEFYDGASVGVTKCHSLPFEEETDIPKTDPCEEGHQDVPGPQYDGQGIYLCQTCSACHDFKMSKYRPEILRPYSQADVDEPINPED